MESKYYAYSRELFESDTFSLSEEEERDSAYPEYESFVRPRILEDDHFIAVRYPLPAGSISYSSSESESETETTMAGPPTREEYDRLVLQIDALNRAITTITALAPAPPRVASSVILEYNYPNTLLDLALATVVHDGLHSQ